MGRGAENKPEILVVVGLGGPGSPENPAKMWGARPPTYFGRVSRGRPNPQNLGFPVFFWLPPSALPLCASKRNTVQVTDVGKPVASVSRILEKGLRVVFTQ